MSGLLLASAFEGHEIRVAGTPDAPEWIAKDVCEALGIKRVDRALSRLKPTEKGAHTVSTPGGDQSMSTVNEPGLYRLIFTSRKSDAERFKDWVFHEVLPAIRKTGTYSVAGMVMVREDAWREQQDALITMLEAYELQAQAATKTASLAASIMASRRHSKPKDDPRQKLLRFEDLGDEPRLAGGAS